MSSRAKKREAAAARREQVELAEQVIRHPPLWPWDASQWETPAIPEKRGRGRPAKPQRPVDRMIEARGVLHRRFIKKASTAQAAAPGAAAGRRAAGAPLRDRVIAEAQTLVAAGIERKFLARRIVEILDTKCEHRDTKHVRAILRGAGIHPAK